MTDKSKAQQEWEWMDSFENEFTRQFYKGPNNFKSGVSWTLNNLDKVPQVKELIEASIEMHHAYEQASELLADKTWDFNFVSKKQYEDLLTEARKLRDELKKLSGLRLKIVDEFDVKYPEVSDE